MNHIDVMEFETQNGQSIYYWSIDGEMLPQILDLMVKDIDDEYIAFIKSFVGLYPAWDWGLDWLGDVRFVWKLIDMDSVPLPLLLCDEDMDFTCIVIVVDIEKNEDFVYWKKIGYVKHDNENFDEEKQSGILAIEKYTDEDWEKYGDNIALEKVDSQEWCQWINKHWDEELYRRRMNYTLPYYQKEGNIKWFAKTDWVFGRQEYESMVEKYKNITRSMRNRDIGEFDDKKTISP